ncbi:MAG: hypothetical protein M3P30_01345 [Chloroflexota bacterium]|nr:hypothetical protein [Chloroflexota bacterium]
MTNLLLNDATLLDGTGADPRERVSLLVEDARVSKIAPRGRSRPQTHAAPSIAAAAH